MYEWSSLWSVSVEEVVSVFLEEAAHTVLER